MLNIDYISTWSYISYSKTTLLMKKIIINPTLNIAHALIFEWTWSNKWTLQTVQYCINDVNDIFIFEIWLQSAMVVASGFFFLKLTFFGELQIFEFWHIWEKNSNIWKEKLKRKSEICLHFLYPRSEGIYYCFLLCM